MDRGACKATIPGVAKSRTELSMLTHTTLWERHYCYPHFADKGTEDQIILLKLSQLVAGRPRLKAQAVDSRVQVLSQCTGPPVGSPDKDHTPYKSRRFTVLSGRQEGESHARWGKFWHPTLAAPLPSPLPSPTPSDFANDQSWNQVQSFRTIWHLINLHAPNLNGPLKFYF